MFNETNDGIFAYSFVRLAQHLPVFCLIIDAEVRPEDSFKFHYVFKGPKKDGKVKRMYYVYGTSLSAKDEGIKQEPYRPVGKGYNWPESYRKANNLYYELTFGDQGKNCIHFGTDTVQKKNKIHTHSIHKPATSHKVLAGCLCLILSGCNLSGVFRVTLFFWVKM